MAAYRNAVEELYKDTYAISNPAEYWCDQPISNAIA